jgi:hypothetical protein
VAAQESDAGVVEAVGKVTEALEWVERARGRLYDFHQLIGHADLVLDEAVESLRSCGHDAWAHRLVEEVVGRNVLDGRWSYQVVEEFDDGYYADFGRYARELRDALAGGERHRFEAALKQRRRSDGRGGHEAAPPRRG